MRNGTKIPIHGGPAVGEFNVIVTHFDPKAGYVGVLHGSSYVQVVRVTGGCPNVHTVQTCSQSVDPTSPYYADQTKIYSAKQWMRWPFCPGRIARDPALKLTLIGGGYRQPRHRG